MDWLWLWIGVDLDLNLPIWIQFLDVNEVIYNMFRYNLRGHTIYKEIHVTNSYALDLGNKFATMYSEVFFIKRGASLCR